MHIKYVTNSCCLSKCIVCSAVCTQYFRQCIQYPPPLSHQQQQQQHRPSHSGVSQATIRHSGPSSSTPNTNQSRFYAPRCTGDVAKLNGYPSSPDARHLPCSQVHCGQVRTSSVPARGISEPPNEGKPQRDLAVRHAVDDDRVNARLDTVSNSQKIVSCAEELSSPEDRKDKSAELVGNHADLVYRCEWTTASRDSCRDSGCMSDLSSGGGSSPPTTASPHQSIINDCTVNDQVSDDDYALTKHLSEMELDCNHDDSQQQIAPSNVQPNVLAPAVSVAVSVQNRAWAPSVPRYVRSMREIPPRFQRLLAAEVERVVRLCQRLNGSPLYSAATPSNGVDIGATSSDISRDNQQGACLDKVLTGQTAYSMQSSLIYVTAQSSGLPVYPPAASGISLPLDGCGVEPTSYVVPVGVADPSLHGLPTAAEVPPPPLPMFVANPVFYYPSATLPPPDVESAFSYVMQSPVVGGTAETGNQSGPPGYFKNVQSDPSVVGVLQPASNDGRTGQNSYCYNSPCSELLPCSLQMMQAS